MAVTARTESVETRVAGDVAAALKRNGVPYLFGIPGGGSSIDLIEACRTEGIPFVLVQHETTAGFMAVVCGELTGSCGACISIMGPQGRSTWPAAPSMRTWSDTRCSALRRRTAPVSRP